MTASREMVELQRAMLRDAVAAGQLGPGADSEETVHAARLAHLRRVHDGDGERTRRDVRRGSVHADLPAPARAAPALYPPD